MSDGRALGGGGQGVAIQVAQFGVLRRLQHSRTAMIAAAGILVLVATAGLAEPIAGSTTAIDPLHVFASPSWSHPLGTDELGRDLLARTLAGGRLSLLIGVAAAAVAMVLGVVWGFAAAGSSRVPAEVLSRLNDAAMAIPGILLALVFVAAFGASVLTLSLISGVLLAPQTARVARSALLAELHADYRLAARAVGASPLRVVGGELLPNVTPTLIAQTSMNIAFAIAIETSLSFLGLGIQPPDASWGTLLQDGYAALYRSVWYSAMPCVAIFLAIMCFNAFGVQLQRALDPREH